MRGKNKFGDLLKSKGVTQMALAERLGVDQTLVSQWCNGKTRMNVECAVRVARILGCDLDEVATSLSESGEAEPAVETA